MSNVVGENGKSFHSAQATSHALQPMQVVVSTSLQTSRSRCMPRPGEGPEWPEIISACNALRSGISLSSLACGTPGVSRPDLNVARGRARRPSLHRLNFFDLY